MIPGWFPSIGVYEETQEMVELTKAKVSDMREEPEEARAYRRCPDGDRATNYPGGMECQDCGCIFIGAEWHSRCAVCDGKRRQWDAVRSVS